MRRAPIGVFLAGLLGSITTGVGTFQAGAAAGPQQIPGPMLEEPAGAHTGFSYVARASRPSANANRTPSPFVVTYNGFSPQAREAFQYAVDIWGSIVQSTVPIRVQASWRTDLPAGVLGAAGAGVLVRDFANAPRANTYYVGALANARARADIATGDEIVAYFNANFEWYLGVDGAAGDRFDFVTIALHEIGHGLGFFGTMRVENGVGIWGFGVPPTPMSYDAFVTSGTGRSLISTASFPNRSTTLANALTGDDVHFTGPATRSAGGVPRLFAPSPYMPGSSIAHLSDAAYPNGDVNSLMTPAIGPSEVVHDPGPMAIRILADMGWPLQPEVAPPQSTPRAPLNVRMLRR